MSPLDSHLPQSSSVITPLVAHMLHTIACTSNTLLQSCNAPLVGLNISVLIKCHPSQQSVLPSHNVNVSPSHKNSEAVALLPLLCKQSMACRPNPIDLMHSSHAACPRSKSSCNCHPALLPLDACNASIHSCSLSPFYRLHLSDLLMGITWLPRV